MTKAKSMTERPLGRVPVTPEEWREILTTVLGSVSGTMVHLPGPQGRDQWFDPHVAVKVEKHGVANGHVVLTPAGGGSTTNAPFDGITPEAVVGRIEAAKRASLVMFGAANLRVEFFQELFAGMFSTVVEHTTEVVAERVESGLQGAIESGLGQMLDERGKTAPTEQA